MVNYTTLYGNLLSAEVHTADDVGRTMPLNVFVYSFHVFVCSLLEFEGNFNRKNFSATYRVRNFLKLACQILYQPINYPRHLIIFAFRTTLAILLGICCATFIFGFSSTAPTAIAMVAEDNIGGTYGKTVNRVGGLVAGTVVPSIFSFFVCKVSSDFIYNTLNNIVLFVWTVSSMYVWFSGRYMALAGMTSAYMATSVLLDHSCRTTSSFTTVSYASLTQNALGILILMIVEIVICPRSSQGLLRSNICQLLTQYQRVFHDVFRHHIAYSHPATICAGPLTEENVKIANALLSSNKIKELKNQLEVTLPELLKTQATFLDGSKMEPTFWKPPFSTSKYTKVLNVCQELLDRIAVLVDLVEWHEQRRSSGKDRPLRRWQQSRINDECTAAFAAAQGLSSPSSALVTETVDEANTHDGSAGSPSPSSLRPRMSTTSPATAKAMWSQSLAGVEAGVEGALDTLVTLFGKEFSGSTAEDHAIYLQMKEAFRIADVHRHGVVDASELSLLLEKLMPYSGRQGIEGMEQYVDEFMQLVDKDRDGKISFHDFMQALNEGFQLELEIYDDQPQVPLSDVVTEANKGQVSPVKNFRLLCNLNVWSNSVPTDTLNRQHHVVVVSPRASKNSSARTLFNFVDTSLFESKRRATADNETGARSHARRQSRFRGMSSACESSALLNVEAFTLTEAAAALKHSYGECLLGYVDDYSRRITMEDFIVMSCVISACENIAENLTRLNTLAAT